MVSYLKKLYWCLGSLSTFFKLKCCNLYLNFYFIFWQIIYFPSIIVPSKLNHNSLVEKFKKLSATATRWRKKPGSRGKLFHVSRQCHTTATSQRFRPLNFHSTLGCAGCCCCRWHPPRTRSETTTASSKTRGQSFTDEFLIEFCSHYLGFSLFFLVIIVDDLFFFGIRIKIHNCWNSANLPLSEAGSTDSFSFARHSRRFSSDTSTLASVVVDEDILLTCFVLYENVSLWRVFFGWTPLFKDQLEGSLSTFITVCLYVCVRCSAEINLR